MNTTDQAQQFGQLRARIESSFIEPATIVITSAGRGDGKSVTAFGLAAALAEADHRVLFVDANVEAPVLPRNLHRPIQPSRTEMAQITSYAMPIAGQRFKALSLADERAEFGASLDRLKAAVANISAHYEYTIVDTGRLTQSNLAALFAGIADATILTVRLGRLGIGADEQTVKTLKRIGANVLGALTVAPAMIKGFRERAAVSSDKGILIPPRHVTSRHTVNPDSVRESADTGSRTPVVS